MHPPLALAGTPIHPRPFLRYRLQSHWDTSINREPEFASLPGLEGGDCYSVYALCFRQL